MFNLIIAPKRLEKKKSKKSRQPDFESPFFFPFQLNHQKQETKNIGSTSV